MSDRSPKSLSTPTHRVDSASAVAFDLETHLIQPGLLAPPIVCGSFAELSGSKLLPREAALAEIEGLLRSRCTLVGANISYDFGCVLAARPRLFEAVWSAYSSGRVYDVQIAATLNAIGEGRLHDKKLFRRDGTVNNSRRYSLSECVRESLGKLDAKKHDEYRLRYAELEHLPIDRWPEAARTYPIDDANNTLQVYLKQSDFLNRHEIAFQSHVAFCVHLGSVWGLRTNSRLVDELEDSLNAEYSELIKFGQECGLVREDGSKDMAAISQLVNIAYNSRPPKTETGRISASRETLDESGHPTLVKFSELSYLEKKRAYLPTLREAASKPLNVEANVLLATGRTSYNGMLQLMPREGGIRECCVAREGYVWSSVDYAAVEMSTLAEVCLEVLGWSDLADAINDDRDPHCILGADLVGSTYEDFVSKYKKDPALKSIRQAGKAGNFGYPGMMGSTKFVIAQKRAGFKVCEWFYRDGLCGQVKETYPLFRQFKQSELEDNSQEPDEPPEVTLCKRCHEKSSEIRASYLERWREIKPYWKWVTAQISGRRGIVQLASRRRRGVARPPAAANSMFQGLAADGAKRAVIALTDEMYRGKMPNGRPSPLLGSRLILFAHDETILEIPEGNAHDAAMRQAEIMVQQMRTVVKRVKVKAEPALMRRWFKGAEPRYDNDGRLIPWEP